MLEPGCDLFNARPAIPMSTLHLPDGGEWTPVVKLSDEKEKYTGDNTIIDLAKKVLHIT